MRPEQLYLTDMLEAPDAIATFIAGHDAESFAAEDLMRSAILMKLIMIGEAASRVSVPLKLRYPETAWAAARRMRNFAAHGYFDADWAIVWRTVTLHVPQLRQQVAAILAAEFPEEAL